MEVYYHETLGYAVRWPNQAEPEYYWVMLGVGVTPQRLTKSFVEDTGAWTPLRVEVP